MLFYLIGYMGCGKSSIGREAARRLGWRFVDMDREVERMHGMSVAEVFARLGEAVFRKSERTVLEELAAGGEDVLVATGGGAPCCGDNMHLMQTSGKTIYLKLSPEKLVLRLKPCNTNRPKLAGMDREQMLAYIRENLPAREGVYEQAAMTIDCDRLSDDAIASYVVEYVRHHVPVAHAVVQE